MNRITTIAFVLLVILLSKINYLKLYKTNKIHLFHILQYVIKYCRSPPINLIKNCQIDWRENMRYEPKKVYVLKNNCYRELSYTEFCLQKDYNNRYFVPIQGMLLEVTKEFYLQYYKEKERNRYLRKLDIENGLLSIDSFQIADGIDKNYLTDTATNVEEKVISDLLLDRLRECISLLTAEEQQLIRQHYYDEISEVELSRKYGISQQAVSKRLKKVRAKLKNLLEQ